MEGNSIPGPGTACARAQRLEGSAYFGRMDGMIQGVEVRLGWIMWVLEGGTFYFHGNGTPAEHLNRRHMLYGLFHRDHAGWGVHTGPVSTEAKRLIGRSWWPGLCLWQWKLRVDRLEG